MTTSSIKKRPDKVEEFKLPMIAEDEAATSDSSLFSIFGLSGGVMGILWKNKYLVWASLFFNIVAYLNQRAGMSERARSGLSAILFSVMALGMLYSQMFLAPRNASIFEKRSNH